MAQGTDQKTTRNYSIPVHFEPNVGQAEASIRYVGRASGAAFLLRDDGVELRDGTASVHPRLVGGRKVKAEPVDRLPGVSHYYYGNDPKKWRTNVPQYARLRMKEVYPGIDMVWYGRESRLEFDFVLGPGADPKQIKLRYDGADSVRLDDHGDIRVAAGGAELIQHKPRVWQDGKEVAAVYDVSAGSQPTIAFRLGEYDPSQPVTIDPIVTWASRFGVPAFSLPYVNTSVNGIAVGSIDQAVFVLGQTQSLSFPTTAGAYDRQFNGLSDVFVLKLAADGKSVVYSTYIGGSADDYAGAIKLDAAGDPFLAGTTTSSDFPVTGGFDTTFNGASDAYVVKLTAAGLLDKGTYFGGPGNEGAQQLAISGNNLYIAGIAYEPGLPTQSAFQTTMKGLGDAFVARFPANLSALVYSTYLGGQRDEHTTGLDILPDGSALVAGWTQSVDFPTTPGAFQTQGTNAPDGFVTRIAAAGSSLVFSTYYKGVGAEFVCGVAYDGAGSFFLAGDTYSFGPPTDLPMRDPLYLPRNTFTRDLFISKWTITGELVRATAYPFASCTAFTVASGGDPIVIGNGTTEFPAVGSWQPTPPLPNVDGIALRLNGAMTQVVYASFLQSAPTVLTAFTNSLFLGGANKSPSVPVIFGSTDAEQFATKVTDGGTTTTITVASVPPGIPLSVDYVARPAPLTITWAAGVQHVLNAPAFHILNNQLYVFRSWRHGGASSQTVIAPGVATTYTADYDLSPCTYSVTPTTRELGLDGGLAVFSVTTQNGCPWDAAGPPVEMRTALAGSGTVAFAVPPLGFGQNSPPATVAGQAVTITQPVGSTITRPRFNETMATSSVDFAWIPFIPGNRYELEITDVVGQRVFFGTITGANNRSAAVSLPDGTYMFSLRSCEWLPLGTGGCGVLGTTLFRVQQIRPHNAPVIVAPSGGQNLVNSTFTFQWTPIQEATSYQIEIGTGVPGSGPPDLRIKSQTTSTVFSMGSGPRYVRVSGCAAACGPWSNPVLFTVTLPPVPTAAPTVTSATLTGSTLNAAWSAVLNADLYIIQVVQPPPAGPGGGSLTVASVRTAALNYALAVPNGIADVIVAACNGNGCGPFSAPQRINVTAPSPAAPVIGFPVSGTIVDGPVVVLSWSRVPGDNGSNTPYRLFALDFSRAAPAADILTTQNFWGLYFKSEGTRYDAVAIANPNTAPVTGPSVGFGVRGNSAASPTMVSPQHQGTVRAGNVTISWTPVTGSSLYQYSVARPGSTTATSSGVTTGLDVTVPLTAINGQPTIYDAIARVCTTGTSCSADSEAGWGPWSTGITKFTVNP